MISRVIVVTRRIECCINGHGATCCIDINGRTSITIYTIYMWNMYTYSFCGDGCTLLLLATIVCTTINSATNIYE
jgi:hypothetical protein